MKAAAFVITLVLVVVCAPATKSAATAKSVATTTGGVTLSVDDVRRFIEFNAITRSDGSVGGTISIRDPTEVPDQDVDGTGDPALAASTSGTEITAEVDDLCVENNTAVLSGLVTSASPGGYVGKRVLLVVEDNGEGGGDPPDQVTWGVYHRSSPRLVRDEENPDAGEFVVGGQRTVRDEENPDAGEFVVGGGDVNCHSFPLGGYTLTPVEGGNIQVRP